MILMINIYINILKSIRNVVLGMLFTVILFCEHLIKKTSNCYRMHSRTGLIFGDISNINVTFVENIIEIIISC